VKFRIQKELTGYYLHLGNLAILNNIALMLNIPLSDLEFKLCSEYNGLLDHYPRFLCSIYFVKKSDAQRAIDEYLDSLLIMKLLTR